MGGPAARSRWPRLGAACAIAAIAGCGGVELRLLGDRDDRFEPALDCGYASADCNPAIDDVIGQVARLPARGVRLGFHRGVLAQPTRKRHWQSIQRLPGARSNCLVVTRSTDRAADPDLGVVELASRPADGGHLARGAPVRSPPPDDDAGIAAVRSTTAHTHAGGSQLVGTILAVPLEDGSPGSRVELFDLDDAAAPRSIAIIDHEVPGGPSSEAGTAALAKLADGRFLLVIGRRDALTLDFYRSTTGDLRATEWAFVDSWHARELRTAIDDTNHGDYQNLQLVAGTDRRLYLVGTHEDGYFQRSHWVDLFAVDGTTQIALTKLAKRQLDCASAAPHCDLDAGGGVYIDPAGALIIYAIERASDGPGGSVKLMEF